MKNMEIKVIYVFDTVFYFYYAKTVWDKYNKINKIKNKNQQ